MTFLQSASAAALLAAMLGASACADQDGAQDDDPAAEDEAMGEMQTQDMPPEDAEAPAGDMDEEPPAVMEASGDIITNDRSELGELTATQGSEGVVIRIEAEGLPESDEGAWHGVHLHMTGDCSSDDFTSSDGHINHSDVPHGLLNDEGPDDGDFPNVWVTADGALNAELYSAKVSLNGEDGKPALLDEDGSALVIHAGEDDHESQPIGGAGDRIGCAVIEAAE